MSLISLQGYVRIGTRLPNGKPGPMHWAGNVPEATLQIAEETTDKNESFSGQRLSYGRLGTSRSGTFNGTFDEWSLKNLALGLYGTALNTATGSVTDEELPNDLAVGDHVRLDRPYASELVITDSTADTPATVDSEHYRLIGHNACIVEILDLASYVQPLKAAYTYAAFDSIEVFTAAAPERYVVFDGINTETGEPVLIDIYRARFAPFADLGLIHQEYGALPFSSAVLFDELNVDANGKGGFFRYTQKAPT